MTNIKWTTFKDKHPIGNILILRYGRVCEALADVDSKDPCYSGMFMGKERKDISIPFALKFNSEKEAYWAKGE